jgi:hypothetical protein
MLCELLLLEHEYFMKYGFISPHLLYYFCVICVLRVGFPGSSVLIVARAILRGQTLVMLILESDHPDCGQYHITRADPTTPHESLLYQLWSYISATTLYIQE